MKTLKIMVATVAVVLSCFAAKGKNTHSEKLSVTYAINSYVEAFSHGRINGFSKILDDNAKLITSRGSHILSYNKAEIVNMLKDIRGVEQNCKTSYRVIENLPNQVIVKVSMNYDLFTKTSYITMSQTGKGWKVTHISSAFNNL